MHSACADDAARREPTAKANRMPRVRKVIGASPLLQTWGTESECSTGHSAVLEAGDCCRWMCACVGHAMLSLVRRQRRSWMVPRLVECSAASHQRVSNLLMGLRFANTSVIAVVAVALCQLPNAAQPQLDSITDPDAYAVYAAVIPQAWAHVSKEVLLLQQETEGLKDTCFSSIRTAGAE